MSLSRTIGGLESVGLSCGGLFRCVYGIGAFRCCLVSYFFYNDDRVWGNVSCLFLWNRGIPILLVVLFYFITRTGCEETLQ